MNKREYQKPLITHSNWYILGAGAIGSLWASRFINCAIPVSLICRNSATARQIGGQLTFENQQGRSLYYPHCTTYDHLPVPCERLLITCKAHQTKSALSSIQDAITSKTHFVLLQNGIGVADYIRNQYPNNPLSIGITNEAAYRKACNHVYHAATGETWFGPYDSKSDNSRESATPPSRSSNDLFRNNGSPNESPPNAQHEDLNTLLQLAHKGIWDEDINQRVWQKFAINCAINGLTVVYQCMNGQLLDRQEKQRHLQRICNEIDQILVAAAHPLERPLYDRAILIARQTAQNYSSMLQDFKNQKSLEIGYLNGYLCKLADQHKVCCTENRTLIQTLKKLSV